MANWALAIIPCVIHISIIVLNILHILVISRTTRRMRTIDKVRILPCGFLLVMAILTLPLDVYHAIWDNGPCRLSIKIQESFDVFHVETYLGLNLLSTFTKCRVYKSKSNASMEKNRKCFRYSTVAVFITSLLTSFTFIAYEMMPSLHITNMKCYLVQSVLYNALFVLPTLLLLARMLVVAYRYYTTSRLSGDRKMKTTSPARQLKAVQTSFFIFVASLLCLWIPFVAFKLLFILHLGDLNMFYGYVALCFKLAYFCFHPATDGMTNKRHLQILKDIFLRSWNTLSKAKSGNLQGQDNEMMYTTLQTTRLTQSSANVWQLSKEVNANDVIDKSYSSEQTLYKRRGKLFLPSVDTSCHVYAHIRNKSPQSIKFNTPNDESGQKENEFQSKSLFSIVSTPSSNSDDLSPYEYFTPLSLASETIELQSTCSVDQTFKYDEIMSPESSLPFRKTSEYFSCYSFLQLNM